MAFETLACTNCGSTEVQEVKPNTYFCNHCESVFKYIDPAKLSVGPAFCNHGNPVEVQCQICQTGLCSQRCDVVPAWRGGYDGIVRTQGFGYMEYYQGYDMDVDGPFLSVGKLLTSVALAHKDKGALSHVCYGCVIQAVPVAVNYISAGTICETVRCWSMSAGKCSCCQRGFCHECSTPKALDPPGSNLDRGLRPGATRTAAAAICAWDPEYNRATKTFFVGQLPDGMCQPCLGENSDKIAAMAARICRQDYAGKLVPVNDYTFKVPATSVRRKKYYEERARVEKIAGQYADEVRARVHQLAFTDGTCEREKIPAGRVMPYVGYVVADERDRVSPAAVSEVIWAQPIRTYMAPLRPNRRLLP